MGHHRLDQIDHFICPASQSAAKTKQAPVVGRRMQVLPLQCLVLVAFLVDMFARTAVGCDTIVGASLKTIAIMDASDFCIKKFIRN